MYRLFLYCFSTKRAARVSVKPPCFSHSLVSISYSLRSISHLCRGRVAFLRGGKQGFVNRVPFTWYIIPPENRAPREPVKLLLLLLWIKRLILEIWLIFHRCRHISQKPQLRYGRRLPTTTMKMVHDDNWTVSSFLKKKKKVSVEGQMWRQKGNADKLILIKFAITSMFCFFCASTFSDVWCCTAENEHETDVSSRALVVLHQKLWLLV